MYARIMCMCNNCVFVWIRIYLYLFCECTSLFRRGINTYVYTQLIYNVCKITIRQSIMCGKSELNNLSEM